MRIRLDDGRDYWYLRVRYRDGYDGRSEESLYAYCSKYPISIPLCGSIRDSSFQEILNDFLKKVKTFYDGTLIAWEAVNGKVGSSVYLKPLICSEAETVRVLSEKETFHFPPLFEKSKKEI